jgi:indolepyruvate ferredoxin oxidoreductase beta subunit
VARHGRHGGGIRRAEHVDSRVAQRTGATTYYIEVYPEPIAALGGRRPVLSLLPVPGGIDLVVASELLEAVRTVQNGIVSPDRTLLVTSSSRVLTTAEKMPLGDGRFDSDLLLDVARRHSRGLVAFDMAETARAAGTVVSAVMFGAIAASGVLPFARAAFEAVIRASGRGAEASLAGFAAAWDAIEGSRGAAAVAGPSPAAAPSGTPTKAPSAEWSVALREAFPAATHGIVEIGMPGCVSIRTAPMRTSTCSGSRVLTAERKSILHARATSR